MDFATFLNNHLQPAKYNNFLAVDLFAGCGGLALGFESQGFATHGYEKDESAGATYRTNLEGPCECVTLGVDTPLPPCSVIIGGPPCQPFSVGGQQHGLQDTRDGFPIFISAVKRLQPDIWLFENVRGLLYRNKAYFHQILNALKSLGYIVEFRLLNAVDFGVPQNRERVIVVGHRGKFNWPDAQRGRVSAGEALRNLTLKAPSQAKFLTPSMDAYIARYEKASFCVRPRDLHLDKPARTLTCRNLAGATGDMQRILLPDGRRRRLFIEEAARLQTFPDWFQFVGSEASQFNQIGNAVPPLFAFYLAASVRTYLNSGIRFNSSEISRRNQSLQPLQLSLEI